MKRPPQSSQSVPYSHCASTPCTALSEPSAPSWQTPLYARMHVFEHHKLGGGAAGGGIGGGEGGGEGGYI